MKILLSAVVLMVRFGKGNCSTDVTSCNLKKKERKVEVNVKDIKHKQEHLEEGH